MPRGETVIAETLRARSVSECPIAARSVSDGVSFRGTAHRFDPRADAWGCYFSIHLFFRGTWRCIFAPNGGRTIIARGKRYSAQPLVTIPKNDDDPNGVEQMRFLFVSPRWGFLSMTRATDQGLRPSVLPPGYSCFAPLGGILHLCAQYVLLYTKVRFLI